MPLVFSLIFTVASRLFHLYSTVDKTSRLKMKSFSTVRDTQRGSQLHGEEKREEGDKGDQDEMRGIKREESKLASNHFLMCTPQSGPLRDVHRVIQKRGEGGRRQRWPVG